MGVASGLMRVTCVDFRPICVKSCLLMVMICGVVCSDLCSKAAVVGGDQPRR